MSDNTSFTLLMLGGVLVLLAIVAALHYNENILPQKMAEKGYCKVVVEEHVQWQPCLKP